MLLKLSRTTLELSLNRCNLSGADLNRQWISPSKILHSVPFALSQMLKSYSHTEISFFIDLHGHSKKYENCILLCLPASAALSDKFVVADSQCAATRHASSVTSAENRP